MFVLKMWHLLEQSSIILICRFEPLDHDATERLYLECGPCCNACYPSEDDEEMHYHFHARNTYQSPTPTMAVSAQWGGGETLV